MIRVTNGNYVNSYAELDKAFTIKGIDSYTSAKNGQTYYSVVASQSDNEGHTVDFKFSVGSRLMEMLKNKIDTEVFLVFNYNPFGKFDFQRLVCVDFDLINS